MKFLYDDGGRAAAGFKGKGRDCAVRSIAICTGLNYIDVYRKLSLIMGRPAIFGFDPKKKEFKQYMLDLGFAWKPTMKIGSGCKVHLRADELPAGRLVCRLSGHYVAVIDGVIHDLNDPSRGGARCVYGYYIYQDKL